MTLKSSYKDLIPDVDYKTINVKNGRTGVARFVQFSKTKLPNSNNVVQFAVNDGIHPEFIRTLNPTEWTFHVEGVDGLAPQPRDTPDELRTKMISALKLLEQIETSDDPEKHEKLKINTETVLVHLDNELGRRQNATGGSRSRRLTRSLHVRNRRTRTRRTRCSLNKN